MPETVSEVDPATADLPHLVLIPGLLCDHNLWVHQIYHLHDIVQTHVAEVSAHDNMHDMAAAVLAAAPPTFVLGALSMGGYIALEIMRQAPERVERLALMDTSARPDTPERTRRRLALIERAKAGRFRDVMPRLLPFQIHPDRQFDEVLTNTLFAMADRIGPEAFMRQESAIMNRIDSRPFLAAIKCPTLLVVGREDALTPPEVLMEIQAQIPGSRLAIIEECGHLPPIEAPQTITTLLRYWMTYG
ncbi:Alpha/beta hydrolase [uncultured Gammaproteobacteria bacterium]